MTERLAFLRHICESPADDLPRLVFADWLDEHQCHERAEFIRLQVKHPQWVGFGESERKPYKREWRFIRTEYYLIRESFPIYAPVRFRRGFLETVGMSAADWLAHADRLYWHPGQTEAGDWQDEYGNHRAVRTPRSCPETAQPITEVTLTTMPGEEDVRCVDVGGYVGLQFIGRDKKHDRRGRPGYAIPWMLADEWPGVTFALPPEPLSGNFGTLTVNGQTVPIVGQWTMGGTS